MPDTIPKYEEPAVAWVTSQKSPPPNTLVNLMRRNKKKKKPTAPKQLKQAAGAEVMAMDAEHLGYYLAKQALDMKDVVDKNMSLDTVAETTGMSKDRLWGNLDAIGTPVLKAVARHPIKAFSLAGPVKKTMRTGEPPAWLMQQASGWVSGNPKGQTLGAMSVEDLTKLRENDLAAYKDNVNSWVKSFLKTYKKPKSG